MAIEDRANTHSYTGQFVVVVFVVDGPENGPDTVNADHCVDVNDAAKQCPLVVQKKTAGVCVQCLRSTHTLVDYKRSLTNGVDESQGKQHNQVNVEAALKSRRPQKGHQGWDSCREDGNATGAIQCCDKQCGC